MQGTVGIISFTDGSCAVMFYPLSRPTAFVADYQMVDLNGLKQFFASINVTRIEELIQKLMSVKALMIDDLNPPDDVLKRYGLI